MKAKYNTFFKKIIICCNSKSPILGVKLLVNKGDLHNLNLKNRILNLKNLLRLWKSRYLSLKGKVTIVNILALSPLLYLASVLHTPDNVIKEVKQCIVDFIWDGGSSKIAYDVIIQQIQDGGLKLIDFGEKIKALKIIWVKRLTDGTPQRWKAAPAVFYNTSSFSDYFSYNQNPIINILQFYQDVQKYWSQVQTVETFIAEEIFNQIIWNNRYITIKNKPFE